MKLINPEVIERDTFYSKQLEMNLDSFKVKTNDLFDFKDSVNSTIFENILTPLYSKVARLL